MYTRFQTFFSHLENHKFDLELTFLQKKNCLFLDLHQVERSHLVRFLNNSMNKLYAIKDKKYSREMYHHRTWERV